MRFRKAKPFPVSIGNLLLEHCSETANGDIGCEAERLFPGREPMSAHGAMRPIHFRDVEPEERTSPFRPVRDATIGTPRDDEARGKLRGFRRTAARAIGGGMSIGPHSDARRGRSADPPPVQGLPARVRPKRACRSIRSARSCGSGTSRRAAAATRSAWRCRTARRSARRSTSATRVSTSSIRPST
jgi:hypothetical protein